MEKKGKSCAKIKTTRSRRSSSSSVHDNDDICGKRQKSRRPSKTGLPSRSVTCVECGQRPQSSSNSATPIFDTWSEKYFHVAEEHVFRRFQCPQAGCDKRFKVLLKLNEHIDQAHVGSRKAAEPPGYHDEVVRKVKIFFPVANTTTSVVGSEITRTTRMFDGGETTRLAARLLDVQPAADSSFDESNNNRASRRSASINDEDTVLEDGEPIVSVQSSETNQLTTATVQTVCDPCILFLTTINPKRFPSYEEEMAAERSTQDATTAMTPTNGGNHKIETDAGGCAPLATSTQIPTSNEQEMTEPAPILSLPIVVAAAPANGANNESPAHPTGRRLFPSYLEERNAYGSTQHVSTNMSLSTTNAAEMKEPAPTRNSKPILVAAAPANGVESELTRPTDRRLFPSYLEGKRAYGSTNMSVSTTNAAANNPEFRMEQVTDHDDEPFLTLPDIRATKTSQAKTTSVIRKASDDDDCFLSFPK